jgi:SAM-dependent methyltransferase
LIAWDARIAREAPFLERLLAAGPDRSVVDLGCGTGEHVAWFARGGARAVGLDRSETHVEAARDHERAGEGRFVLGDVLEARAALAGEAPFGLAICLGNMLPHLPDAAALGRFLREAHGLLAPGGHLLVQILGYERILAQGLRALPVNVRPGEREGEEIVFLRLMSPQPGGRMLFFPATLVLRPDREEPLTVHASRRVELRAWLPAELRAAAEGTGFSVRLHGDMQGGDYDARTSRDLVVVARRS